MTTESGVKWDHTGRIVGGRVRSCAHCGETVKFKLLDIHSGGTFQGWALSCECCGARGPIWDKPARAIALWNARADDQLGMPL